jgi:PKD repeat protein
LLIGGATRADVVVPSSAFSSGQNGAEFRTDVRIFNPTTNPVTVTPVFYNQAAGGAPIPSVPATLVIPPRTQASFDNVLESLFGQARGVFGPIRFGTTASILVSTGVNNVNACGNGSTSGQWLPGIDQGQALEAGTLLQLAASADGATGYRSNVVFTNPGPSNATVHTNLRKGDGTLISSATIGPLGPGGWTQIGALSAWLPSPATITDTNLWLEFTSDQPVLSFASVINNASGDPFAIVMTTEPNVPAPVPVAAYTVAPANPSAGQAATFTDSSSNAPTLQLWDFGDGATATSGATAQHTYAAPGTYTTAHFAGNAAGVSAATKAVVVVAGTPIPVTISATTAGNTKWTFVCQTGPCDGAGNNNVSLRVGQPYVITWTTPASEGRTHGVDWSAAAAFDVSACSSITANQPCTVHVTPTANLAGVQDGVYTYHCTHTECAPNLVVHNSMTGTITIVP